jgi:hypothetical protein
MSIPAAHSYLVLYPFLTVGRYRIPLGDYIEFQLEVILRKVFSKWFYESRKERYGMEHCAWANAEKKFETRDEKDLWEAQALQI